MRVRIFIFVSHIRFKRCHQIGYKVISLLEYHTNATPALFHPVFLGNEIIRGDYTPNQYKHSYCDKDTPGNY